MVWFLSALFLDPSAYTFPMVYAWQSEEAHTAFREKNFSQAIRHLELARKLRAFAIDKREVAWNLNNLAHFYVRNQDVRAAVPVYREALLFTKAEAFGKEFWYSVDRYARLLFRHGMLTEAIDLMELIEKQNSGLDEFDRGSLEYRLALAKLVRGDLKGCKKHCKQACELFSTGVDFAGFRPRTKLLLVHAHLMSNNNVAAREILEESAELESLPRLILEFHGGAGKIDWKRVRHAVRKNHLSSPKETADDYQDNEAVFWLYLFERALDACEDDVAQFAFKQLGTLTRSPVYAFVGLRAIGARQLADGNLRGFFCTTAIYQRIVAGKRRDLAVDVILPEIESVLRP